MRQQVAERRTAGDPKIHITWLVAEAGSSGNGCSYRLASDLIWCWYGGAIICRVPACINRVSILISHSFAKPVSAYQLTK